MQHIYTFNRIVYNGAQKSVLTLAHTQINKGGLLTNPLLVAIPYTFIYNTILQLNIVKNNINSNNNCVLIGNDNTLMKKQFLQDRNKPMIQYNKNDRNYITLLLMFNGGIT